MSSGIQQLKDVVDQSSTIMGALQSATEPLPETIESLTLESRARQEEYTSLIGEIRAFNEATSSQAQQLVQTWDSHKTRFEQIDQGLAQAFVALSDQIEQYVQSTQSITSDIDKNLGNGVATLGGFMEDLQDAHETLNTLVEDLRKVLDAQRVD